MTLEEKEINNCLIMRIKKLKEQVKNLVQQVIGSCILAFTKNKKEKQDEQTTFNSKAYHEQIKRIDTEIKLEKAKKLLEKWLFFNGFNSALKKETEDFLGKKTEEIGIPEGVEEIE